MRLHYATPALTAGACTRLARLAQHHNVTIDFAPAGLRFTASAVDEGGLRYTKSHIIDWTILSLLQDGEFAVKAEIIRTAGDVERAVRENYGAAAPQHDLSLFDAD